MISDAGLMVSKCLGASPIKDRHMHSVLNFLLLAEPQAEDEYMISDVDLIVNKYVSVPRDMGSLNCAAFVAGIVKGALDNAGFPARC